MPRCRIHHTSETKYALRIAQDALSSSLSHHPTPRPAISITTAAPPVRRCTPSSNISLSLSSGVAQASLAAGFHAVTTRPALRCAYMRHQNPSARAPWDADGHRGWRSGTQPRHTYPGWVGRVMAVEASESAGVAGGHDRQTNVENTRSFTRCYVSTTHSANIASSPPALERPKGLRGVVGARAAAHDPLEQTRYGG